MRYADVPLAMCAGATALYLLLRWRQWQLVNALLMGLLAGGAVWTKKEGMALAALLVLVYAGEEVLRCDARVAAQLWSSVWVVLAALVLPLPWLLFRATTDPIGSDYGPLTPAWFVAHMDQYPAAALALLVAPPSVDA